MEMKSRWLPIDSIMCIVRLSTFGASKCNKLSKHLFQNKIILDPTCMLCALFKIISVKSTSVYKCHPPYLRVKFIIFISK